MFFLYRGRPYTHAAAKHRIDAVVRGLIHIGVRRGDPVGVLMGTRPTALALVAALSRLGAVAVLLRPDGDPAAEARLGRVTRVIADPEHAARAAKLDGVQAYLLGGAGRGDRGPLTDMEDIDPERVEPPGWYRPNPGRAATWRSWCSGATASSCGPAGSPTGGGRCRRSGPRRRRRCRRPTPSTASRRSSTRPRC
ncbi:AMP-binding protein [Actinomadura madurae]|uniref:AMP-binding protein n=1 Tax=Actinomadura madurae TaxID=1993 RepID=UPI0020D25A41|nr:AMP-binding protein [Actinomadura madurae]MCP9954040.1 AMP-binding protein [Actinomadura madurae]